jgi:hypothetical protein
MNRSGDSVNSQSLRGQRIASTGHALVDDWITRSPAAVLSRCRDAMAAARLDAHDRIGDGVVTSQIAPRHPRHINGRV